MKLQPTEVILAGQWVLEDGKVRGDEVCRRIKALIASHLDPVAVSPESGGWERLFRDPADGRYWEQTFPQGELHGGGPPQLKCLSVEAAKTKYRLSAH